MPNKDHRHRDPLAALFAMAPIGLAQAHDALAQRISINPALAKILGLAPGTTKPKFSKAFHKGAELAENELPLQRAVRENLPIRDIEIDIVRQDGTVRSIISFAEPIVDDDNQVVGGIAAFLDATERHQLGLLRQFMERM